MLLDVNEPVDDLEPTVARAQRRRNEGSADVKGGNSAGGTRRGGGATGDQAILSDLPEDHFQVAAGVSDRGRDEIPAKARQRNLADSPGRFIVKPRDRPTGGDVPCNEHETSVSVARGGDDFRA